MKNYEKKYKEALERASRLRVQNPFDTISQMMEHVFPELKESEDEQHRKWILEYLYDGLRKADEQFKPQFASAIGWLEKQDGQKHTNNVEPKFHEGDWIIHHGTENIYQVVACIDNQYQLKYGDTYTIQKCADVDRCARLWNIKDAKDGDVVIAPYIKGTTSYETIFIFKEIKDREYAKNVVEYYCSLANDKFKINKGFCCFMGYGYDYFTPATKEQRDLLFQKIREEGYELNAEKKEFKQMEQKPTDNLEPKFKVGDWVVVSTSKEDRVVQIASVEYFTKDGYPSYITTEGRWFGNGTKARLLTDKDMKIITIPESKVVTVNEIKSWTADDDEILQHIIQDVELLLGDEDERFKDERRQSLIWLKSLKQKIGWKPSEKQIKALHDLNLVGNISNVGQGQLLIELYNDLMKLIE